MRLRIAAVLFASLLLPASAALAKSATTSAPKLNAQSFPIAVPAQLAEIINEAAKQFRVDPNLIAAMAFRESRFDAFAVSRRGAQGIMQLMPRTARALGVRDSFDPRQNVFGGTKYLRELLDRFDGNIDLALAGYNAGPERVAKEGPRATQEAVEYVAAVKQYYYGSR